MIAMVVSNTHLDKMKDFVRQRLAAIGCHRASFVLLQFDAPLAFPQPEGSDDPEYLQNLLLILDQAILLLEQEGKVRVHGDRSTPRYTAVELLQSAA
jgi:hypothetical protein